MQHYKEVDYYYDSHSMLEDVMTECPEHQQLVYYLMAVLEWQFEGQVCALHANMGIYHDVGVDEPSLAPDLCVFKGIVSPMSRSWKLGQTGPAPQVVFEIASPETWRKDRDEKPGAYALMGVKEYYLYDPFTPQVMKRVQRRLLGWQLSADGHAMPLLPDQTGRMWSMQLQSYLVPDGRWLRLTETDGQLRLTKAEAFEQEARMFEDRAHKLEQGNHILVQKNRTLAQDKRTLKREKRTLEQKNRRSDERAQALEQEKLLSDQRAQTLEQEKLLSDQRAQALEEKLRALGINLDE